MKETPIEDKHTDETHKPVSNSSTPVWMWLLPVLILPVAIMAWFNSISEDRASKIINEAAFVAPGEIKNYCDTGKVLRTTLYTCEHGFGDDKAQFAYLRLDESVPAGKGNQWIKIESEPKVLELFDKQKSIEIKMNDTDLDKANIPVTFNDTGARRDHSVAPDAWKKLMPHENHKYMLQTLACSQKVNLAGTFWRTKDGIFVKGFEYTFVGPGKFSSPACLSVAGVDADAKWICDTTFGYLY